MKKYILLFLLPLLLIGLKTKAQDSLGISHYTYFQSSNDTVLANSSDSTIIWVVNRKAIPFSGDLKIKTAVQDSASTLYHQVDSVDFGFQTISGGDSIQFKLYPFYNILPIRYHYDINVIVIWPVASFWPAADSLTFTEVIPIWSGVNELDLNNYIKIYPNPTIDKFTIENDNKNPVEEVRIYNAKGQLMDNIKNESFINIESWSNGIYFIDVKVKNQKWQTLKVIKQ
jgi:hypothetical protein